MEKYVSRVFERREGYYTGYEVEKTVNGSTHTREIKFYQGRTMTDNGEMFILFDADLKSIQTVYEYINVTKADLSANSKLKCLNAIKYFYVFMSITMRSLKDTRQVDIDNFAKFLMGREFSSLYTMYVSLNYSPTIAYSYAAVVGNYLYTSDILDKKFIAKKRRRAKKSLSGSSIDYITEVQMYQLRNYIQADLSISHLQQQKYLLMVDILYHTGLRIGELLGLTIEDVHEIVDKKTLKKYGELRIRNRVTDDYDQRAKGAITVHSKNDYKDKYYKKEGIGYEVQIIKYELLERIFEFYDEQFNYHNDLNREFKIADSVEKKQTIEFNTYLFLNERNTDHISRYSFSNYLRKGFIAVGCHVDKGYRKSNLVHKFRHSLAMRLVHVLRVSPDRAGKILRHSDPKSIQAYLSINESEIAELVELLGEEFKYDE